MQTVSDLDNNLLYNIYYNLCRGVFKIPYSGLFSRCLYFANFANFARAQPILEN